MNVTDKHREDAKTIIGLMVEMHIDAWEPLANLLAGYDAGCAAEKDFIVAGIKAEAAEYKRLYDALFEIEGLVQSDFGNVTQWVDEIIQSVQTMIGFDEAAAKIPPAPTPATESSPPENCPGSGSTLAAPLPSGPASAPPPAT